jgi:hypothetical protein
MVSPGFAVVIYIFGYQYCIVSSTWGSALTEAENWDVFADCTSRDGRKISDAGVHLSDKRTMSLGFTNIAKEDTQMVSNTVQHILSESASACPNNLHTIRIVRTASLSSFCVGENCLSVELTDVWKPNNTFAEQ